MPYRHGSKRKKPRKRASWSSKRGKRVRVKGHTRKRASWSSKRRRGRRKRASWS